MRQELPVIPDRVTISILYEVRAFSVRSTACPGKSLVLDGHGNGVLVTRVLCYYLSMGILSLRAPMLTSQMFSGSIALNLNLPHLA